MRPNLSQTLSLPSAYALYRSKGGNTSPIHSFLSASAYGYQILFLPCKPSRLRCPRCKQPCTSAA